jgi:hypothetical protein
MFKIKMSSICWAFGGVKIIRKNLYGIGCTRHEFIFAVVHRRYSILEVTFIILIVCFKFLEIHFVKKIIFNSKMKRIS